MAQIPFSDRERKCPVCGKEFILRNDEWAFKRVNGNRTKYFCSWHCLQAFVQEHPKKVAVETRDKIIELIRKGLPTSEIVRTLGVEKSKVKYWQARVEKDYETLEGGKQDGSLED